MPTTLGIQISLTGTITISDVTPITAPTFVDWWTWQAAGITETPIKNPTPTSYNITSSAQNRVSETLAAGDHVFLVSHLSAGTRTTLTVGGIAATLVETDVGATSDLVTQVWKYTVPSAGVYDIDVGVTSGASLNRLIGIFKINDGATVTATTTLPITDRDASVLGITSTVNNSSYIPDTTSTGDVTQHSNIDTRSGEWVNITQYDALDADITADANYSGSASSWSGIWAILS